MTFLSHVAVVNSDECDKYVTHVSNNRHLTSGTFDQYLFLSTVVVYNSAFMPGENQERHVQAIFLSFDIAKYMLS